MVRNIIVLGGNSHPQLVDSVCNILGVSPCSRILGKFSVGETRCEIQDSVRGKDVYIIQTGAGKVNDALMDLLIMISALKTGSARRVTAVLPLFPYSRQPDAPYKKAGAPLSKRPTGSTGGDYTFDSVPPTPGAGFPMSAGLVNGSDMTDLMSKTSLTDRNGVSSPKTNGEGSSRQGAYNGANGVNGTSGASSVNGFGSNRSHSGSISHLTGNYTTHDFENPSHITSFEARPGYKQWVAQAGTLVADLLTCAGADHIITLDLHDSQYQGYFDVPVDNLYARPALQRYITLNIPNFREAVIVSPDAGGAKRATTIADALGLSFSLIHKERRPTKITQRQNASMMLVGDVTGRVCILIDDLIDTGNTITRAAKLLKKEGATMVYALVTHGVFSGDAIDRVKQSAIDKLVATNSVPQDEHKARLGAKLDVIDICHILAEAIRRSHHGESLSSLFQYV